ncbi:unnamed protein product [Ilex paraguariensis]|uniref:Ninja-family protein n=1 Tax=Ilex paraguariensis TaxID=185542 RepID=A0ABC8UYV5_9AQUA
MDRVAGEKKLSLVDPGQQWGFHVGSKTKPESVHLVFREIFFKSQSPMTWMVYNRMFPKGRLGWHISDVTLGGLFSIHGFGSSSCGEASPASIHSLQEQSNPAANPDAAGSSGVKTKENKSSSSVAEVESGSRRNILSGNMGREIGKNSMEDMPCVFTKGDGPNGRRIEGILYKYGKGEEIRIMCVCHGSFLSPAEFVKHAGGGDVAHPLKHIVVNPNSSFSL